VQIFDKTKQKICDFRRKVINGAQCAKLQTSGTAQELAKS
jgi:hypothetical protein